MLLLGNLSIIWYNNFGDFICLNKQQQTQLTI